MTLYGGVYFNDDGLSTSIRGMHLQTELLNISNNNITGFGKVGYQRQVPVVSSFAEYIGVNALSKVQDNSIGRVRKSNNPLDFAMGKEGYFQCQTPNGIKLTRDGRFKLDKNGSLLTLDGNKVLGSNGQPIKFNAIPDKLEDVKVNIDGTIQSLNPKTKQMDEVGQIAVATSNGTLSTQPDVRQGFVEDSNVSLSTEFLNIVPIRRNFDANRQMFITQNDELSRTIQELSRAT